MLKTKRVTRWTFLLPAVLMLCGCSRLSPADQNAGDERETEALITETVTALQEAAEAADSGTISQNGTLPEKASEKSTMTETENAAPEEVFERGTEPEAGTETDNRDTNEEETALETEETDDSASILAKARLLAAQYNYDEAIRLLKSQEDYENNGSYRIEVAAWQEERDSCVEYPLDQITHVFFHSLIVDTSRAFDGDGDSEGYNQYMTTVSEFRRMLEILYEEGYVLVSPHDMAAVCADGTLSRGSILLPEGKTPFVLSQDDVSYYHYMDNDGFASKLVLDENGKVKCEYTDADGNILTENYDLVPILDAFVEENPSFSYHGRKGILAMTGYDGVLGYRTDIAYKTGENLQDDQKEFLDTHPDFDYEAEVKAAKTVAAVMKENGWEFASHTWGHRNVDSSTVEELKTDDAKWKAYVEPILGETDMILFPFGADIGSWEGYSVDNLKFQYYKSAGYHYFCNVDSSQYFVQITDQYFRQGRRDLDGYRMYYNPEMLSDLFEVSEVWDSSRPTPVQPIG